MSNQLVKDQFNKQAEKFANWSVGKNVEYLNSYFDFCEISPDDKLLDVACGPGEFTIFTARKISEAYGIDISDKEIDIAKSSAKNLSIDNVHFNCADVEKLPYNDNTFSIVVCKSAFHHFINPVIVLDQMKRCCMQGGKISVQDIVSYDDEYVKDFFETFDKLVDISHNRVLSIGELNRLFQECEIKKIREFSIEVDLSVKEYVDHAVQEPENVLKINDLLNKGINDKRLSGYLFKKNGELYFKRLAYLILGIK